ncbi:MAG TPA: helix-turn-helix domain-containing protein [Pseudonocardiaceae bacterium]
MSPAELSSRQAAEETQQTLRGDWVIAVVTALGAGPKRFNELQAEINAVEERVGRRLHSAPVSNRVLASTLDRMAGDGLVVRHEAAHAPHPFVWYELTTAGRELIPVLQAMAGWAERHRS